MRLLFRVIAICLLLMISVNHIFAAPPAYQSTAEVTQIETLVADMEAAVLADDMELYLSYVDLSEPHFALEHTRWAEDWSTNDFLTDFALRIEDIQVEDDIAVGSLTLAWETSLPEQPGQEATFPVEFHRIDNEWFYAGEFWLTTETDHFIVRFIPGLEDSVDELIRNLPAVYDEVTTAFGYEPEARMMIKLYLLPETLVAVTLLSLPLISGWNEPGEALKAIGTIPDDLPGIVAHEFTHFLSFEQAGSENASNRVWWLEEGMAVYFAEPFDESETSLAATALMNTQSWLANDELVDWAELADFNTTPVELWGYVYIQGYSFVRFLTEEYGQDTRNQWLYATGDLDIEAATEMVFDESFEELDARFREWLRVYEGQR